MWLPSPYLVLLFCEQGLVGVDELQIGGGCDVDVAPLLTQEGLAQGLHTLMEQDAQVRHHRSHLQAPLLSNSAEAHAPHGLSHNSGKAEVRTGESENGRNGGSVSNKQCAFHWLMKPNPVLT